MYESQNIEWKESWRDEYLKTICAFANTQGGYLDIGRDNNGNLTGLAKTSKLLEDIPSKLRNILGLTADVALLTEKEKQFIRITVDAYPNPISYKNQYYIRSGSTTSSLTGSDLNAFIMRKFGQTWEDVIVPEVSVADLSPIAFSLFRKKAKAKKRINETALDIDNWDLLNKLNLTKGEHITRAGVLLFHEEPERFITNSFVKIGFFKTASDLRFQDVVSGNLFSQLDRTLELLFSKYTKAYIRYEGAQRIEEMPFPQEAMREIVTNAIVHRDYSIPATTQIRVYEDKFIVFSDGGLIDPITVESLNKDHKSIPRNPNLAQTLFLTGNIESWGRGTNKVFEQCKNYGIDPPVYKSHKNMVEVHMQGINSVSSVESIGKDTRKRIGKGSEKILGKTKASIIKHINDNHQITIAELSTSIGIATRTVEKHISQLKELGILNRIGGRKEGYWEITQ